MPELEVIEEMPLTMAELKEKLQSIKKSQDLSFRGNKTMEYINNFVKISAKQVNEIKAKIKELDIIRLKDKHISKIIDIMPQDAENLKTVLVQDNITVKPEDLEKLLECLK